MLLGAVSSSICDMIVLIRKNVFLSTALCRTSIRLVLVIGLKRPSVILLSLPPRPGLEWYLSRYLSSCGRGERSCSKRFRMILESLELELLVPVFVVKPSYLRITVHAIAPLDSSSSLTLHRGSVYVQLSLYSVGFEDKISKLLEQCLTRYTNLP